MVGPRGEIWPFRRPKTRFSNTLFHHKLQGTPSQTYQNISDCMCACACTALLQLRASIAPLHSRFWPCRDCIPRTAMAVRTHLYQQRPPSARPHASRNVADGQDVVQHVTSPPQAPAAAHGVEARRRRRSWYTRCMSDRAARQHRAGSAPSSCTGRELSA